MDGAGGTQTTTPRRRGVLALALVAVLAASVVAVLLLGRAIGDRLEDDDPTEVTVPVTGTKTTTTATEPVVLAPPVSIDRTTTAPGG